MPASKAAVANVVLIVVIAALMFAVDNGMNTGTVTTCPEAKLISSNSRFLPMMLARSVDLSDNAPCAASVSEECTELLLVTTLAATAAPLAAMLAKATPSKLVRTLPVE